MVEAVMTIGPKGQVVVPKQIRDGLSIKPGDRVVVRGEKGSVRIFRAESSVAELFEKLAAMKGTRMGGKTDFFSGQIDERLGRAGIK